MKQEDFGQFVQLIEHSIPVDEWTIGDIHVWPLARALLGWSLKRRLDEGSSGTSPRRLQQHWGLLRGWLRCAANSVRDASHHQWAIREGDLLVLGDGISKVWLREVWYDRHTEPFIEAAALAQLDSTHLEPGRECFIPRHAPSRFIQPRLDLAWLRSRIQTGSKQAHLPAHRQVIEAAQDHGLAASVVAPEQLSRAASSVEAYARYFYPLVKGRRGAVMVDTSLVTMGLNVAARRAGVRSVELQHGFQGIQNWLYSHWTRLPRAGYEVLPQIYWTWGPREAAAIERWAHSSHGSHRAVVGGNLWLRRWVNYPDDNAVRAKAEVASALASRPKTRHVLVTLQPGYEDVVVRLVSAAASLDKSVAWWIRLHPVTSKTQRRMTRERLFREGIDLQFVDQASRLPLYSWLSKVNVHVTHSSATVLEAAEFHVPSIVLSNEGFGFFRDYIASEELEVAYDAHDLVRHIREKSTSKRPFTEGEFPDPTDLITQLFF